MFGNIPSAASSCGPEASLISIKTTNPVSQDPSGESITFEVVGLTNLWAIRPVIEHRHWDTAEILPFVRLLDDADEPTEYCYISSATEPS